MKIRIVPYRVGSKSAKLLAQKLSARTGYKVWRGLPRANRLNIRWGIPEHPAANKLETFKLLEQHGVSHVPYTVSKEAAQAWLEEGRTVFARTLHGQGGSGITVVSPDSGGDLPDRPLYTLYVKKKKEFRVHVVNGQVIDVQQKKRRNGVESSSLIRNLENGWVFCHDDVVEPASLREIGVAAVGALGLRIGAVDIIWNESQNKCYTLEVNTAPGLCESTAERYANAIIA